MRKTFIVSNAVGLVGAEQFRGYEVHARDQACLASNGHVFRRYLLAAGQYDFDGTLQSCIAKCDSIPLCKGVHYREYADCALLVDPDTLLKHAGATIYLGEGVGPVTGSTSTLETVGLDCYGKDPQYRDPYDPDISFFGAFHNPASSTEPAYLYDTGPEHFDYMVNRLGFFEFNCDDCNPNHQKSIVYKRLTPFPDDFSMHHNVFHTWGSEDNLLNVDFKLYSSLEDYYTDSNAWTFCNYGDEGVGFPRDCGPTGPEPYDWISLDDTPELATKTSLRRHEWSIWFHNLEMYDYDWLEGNFLDHHQDGEIHQADISIYSYNSGDQPAESDKSGEDEPAESYDYDNNGSGEDAPGGYAYITGRIENGPYSYDVGRAEFDELVAATNLVVRDCSDCARSHRQIVYKRLTPFPSGFSLYDTLFDTWASQGNVLDVDFQLFSSLADALTGTNPWTFCNYDDEGVGFPRDCGPQGYVPWQWVSFTQEWGSSSRKQWRFSFPYLVGGLPEDGPSFQEEEVKGTKFDFEITVELEEKDLAGEIAVELEQKESAGEIAVEIEQKDSASDFAVDVPATKSEEKDFVNPVPADAVLVGTKESVAPAAIAAATVAPKEFNPKEFVGAIVAMISIGLCLGAAFYCYKSKRKSKEASDKYMLEVTKSSTSKSSALTSSASKSEPAQEHGVYFLQDMQTCFVEGIPVSSLPDLMQEQQGEPDLPVECRVKIWTKISREASEASLARGLVKEETVEV